MTDPRRTFTDEQWQRIEPSMPPCKGRPGGAHRRFFDALLWMARTGSPWRDLPERLGAWNVVYQRDAYWCRKGHVERLFQGLQQPDMEEVMVDSTCCRAHQSSAGARTISGPQAIGLTRGSLNTKIHAVCDALGNPLRFGQTRPTTRTRWSRRQKSRTCKPSSLAVINRNKNQRVLEQDRYQARHLVENLFQRMKVFRRVATRYDNQGFTFLGFVHIAGTMKWLH